VELRPPAPERDDELLSQAIANVCMNPSTRHLRGIGWWCGIIAPILISIGFFAIEEGHASPGGPINLLVREITDNRARIVAGSLVGMVWTVAWCGSLPHCGRGSPVRIPRQS
jgi:hypothetical protein